MSSWSTTVLAVALGAIVVGLALVWAFRAPRRPSRSAPPSSREDRGPGVGTVSPD